MDRQERIKALYGKQRPEYTPDARDNSRIASLEGDCVHITFKQHADVVALVKRITGRRYISGTTIQKWTAPLTMDCVNKLRQAEFTLNANLKSFEDSFYAPVKYDKKFCIPGIKHFDYFEQYQIEGVQKLEHIMEKHGGALLADDKGMGKTMQVLSWLQLRLDVRPVLIVCPAIAKLTWKAEIDFWMDGLDVVQVISGNKSEKIFGDIVIINYDILTQIKDKKDVIRPDVWGEDWQLVVMDEAHYVSNADTIRGWALQQLTTRASYVLPITASIARNRPKEIYPLVSMVDNRLFPSFFKFGHRYCNPKKGYAGKWEFNGSSNEAELHDLLTKTIMIRRKKEEIFKDHNLYKRRCIVPLELDNLLEYKQAETDFDSYMVEKTGKEFTASGMFTKVEQLKQIAVKGKLKAAIQWITELLETEQKIIIFAEHEFTLNAIQKSFKDICVRIDGKVNNAQKREEARTAFQKCARCGIMKERHENSEDACKSYIPDMNKRVFLGSRAANTNITLTAAYNVVFLEIWWSPEDHDQAEDRAYARKGDLHSITSWYLVGSDTIEEQHLALYDIKNRNLTRIADGKEVGEDHILTELLRKHRGMYGTNNGKIRNTK